MTTTFGGAEAALQPWYAALDLGRVVTELPSDLQTQVPLLQVVGVGGSADPSAPTRLQVIRWVLHHFAVGAPATAALAEAAFKSTMTTLRGSSLQGADVTLVTCEARPAWVPYADTQVRQYVATYNAHILLH